MTDFFGSRIAVYTRTQAIKDGALVDVTEWASAEKGFIGGFVCPVAVTRAVWSDLERCPATQDVRGRAHDLLVMASMAARRGGAEILFSVRLQVGRTKRQTYKMRAGLDDNRDLVVTIMKPEEASPQSVQHRQARR